jgi:predicted protein tyrosine phosphatase
MTKALFICSANMLRSPTAEQVFATWPGVETDSAGTRIGATVRVSAEHIEWADIVFVMEQYHRQQLAQDFGRELRGKKLVVLDIPDDYRYMDPALVEILIARVGPYLKPA